MHNVLIELLIKFTRGFTLANKIRNKAKLYFKKIHKAFLAKLWSRLRFALLVLLKKQSNETLDKLISLTTPQSMHDFRPIKIHTILSKIKGVSSCSEHLDKCLSFQAVQRARRKSSHLILVSSKSSSAFRKVSCEF
jgi:hypothetical protein